MRDGVRGIADGEREYKNAGEVSKVERERNKQINLGHHTQKKTFLQFSSVPIFSEECIARLESHSIGVSRL